MILPSAAQANCSPVGLECSRLAPRLVAFIAVTRLDHGLSVMPLVSRNGTANVNNILELPLRIAVYVTLLFSGINKLSCARTFSHVVSLLLLNEANRQPCVRQSIFLEPGGCPQYYLF